MAMSAAEMKKLAREGIAEGLNLIAERHRAVATPKTPLEYGDLRSAHTVVPATPDDLESAVVNDLPYAAKQHEDLSLRHDDGGPKFFEEASAEIEGEAQQIMAAAIRRKLG